MEKELTFRVQDSERTLRCCSGVEIREGLPVHIFGKGREVSADRRNFKVAEGTDGDAINDAGHNYLLGRGEEHTSNQPTHSRSRACDCDAVEPRGDAVP